MKRDGVTITTCPWSFFPLSLLKKNDSQKLVVEVEADGYTRRRQNPAQVEREDSNKRQKHILNSGEGHRGDLRELRRQHVEGFENKNEKRCRKSRFFI